MLAQRSRRTDPSNRFQMFPKNHYFLVEEILSPRKAFFCIKFVGSLTVAMPKGI